MPDFMATRLIVADISLKTKKVKLMVLLQVSRINPLGTLNVCKKVSWLFEFIEICLEQSVGSVD